MYVLLKDEVKKLDKKPNYMTVPAAIRELEKIELVRQTDGKYCMDHACLLYTSQLQQQYLLSEENGNC